MRVAIVGGGVSGCSLVYGFRDELKSGRIRATLFEMGRGCGGRTATRKTRELAALTVDHGAPAFAARTAEFFTLCDEFARRGSIERLKDAVGVLNSKGVFQREPIVPPRFTGGPNGISSFCEVLLRGGEPMQEPLARTVNSVQVSSATKTSTGWRLSDRQGADLGEFDWLVVTGTGFAHPRWTAVFGGTAPLVVAAEQIGDHALDACLNALKLLTFKPVTACLMAFDGAAADAWARLPFFKAHIEDNATLSRIVIRRINPNLTAVVLHSTHEFSESESDVFGTTSAAARVGGASSNATREQSILSKMQAELKKILVPNALAASDVIPCWGPHLHRWGGGFPRDPLLAIEHAFVPSVSCAFCGDFIASERARTVEGAALSGFSTARKLVELL